jgi:hypothetical protein
MTFALDQPFIGRERFVDRFALLIGFGWRMTVLCAFPLTAAISQNPVHPGGQQAAFIEAFAVLPCLDERFLHQIGRRLRVTAQADRRSC